MGKYSGILICSDFDGTLRGKNGIPENNLTAIKQFQSEGGLFSIITGRSYKFFKKYADKIDFNTYLGAMNGTVIWHAPTDTVVFEDIMKGDYASKILKIKSVCPNFRDLDLYTDGVNIQFPVGSMDFDDNFFKAISKPLNKIVIHGYEPYSDEPLAAIKEILGESYLLSQSWASGIEIQNADCTKGTAVRRIATLTGANKLICVGDYGNDIPMLTEADIGYAVANANDSVKAVADRITVSAEEGAIEKIISEL